MDRSTFGMVLQSTSLMLAIALVIAIQSSVALAQRSPRAGSREVVAKSFKKTTPKKTNQKQVKKLNIESQQQPVLEDEFVDPVGYEDSLSWDEHISSASFDSCCDVGCGNTVGCRPRCGQPSLYAGFEAVLVKPRFENNIAFSTREGDGNSFSNLSDTEFNYDLEFSPRAFLGWRHQDGVGLRASWWQFDHAAATASASPPAGGVGVITHPTFGAVDISTATSTDVFSADSSLNAYVIDIEGTKQTSFRSWDLGIACGIRYAYSEQSYLAQLRNNNNVLEGQIDYTHSIEGIGPTLALEALRPVTDCLSVFGKARGSILFGDGESSHTAGEDLDLTTPFTTRQTNSRDDLLSIAELQLGFRWQASRSRGRLLRPFITAAMEGQIWNGAGNASSEEGTLGFYGANTGFGIEW